jgi:hypothetical protein
VHLSQEDDADVIRQVLGGNESGADEILADEMTRDVRARLGKPIHERWPGDGHNASGAARHCLLQ